SLRRCVLVASADDRAPHQILQVFLTSGDRLRIDIRLDGPVGDRGERGILCIDLLTDLAVPLRIPLFDELVERTLLDQLRRREQRARENVEPADVPVEQIDGIDALTTHLCVEVETAVLEAA